MKIRAQLHCMAESEIMAMIGPDKLAEIKTRDKSPTIKAYVVGHEGEARGNLVGVGNIVKTWFTQMVEKLTDKIKIGLQLFHGHAATNDTTGRIPIGEVVGRKLMNIKDRLSSVVACYIYPDYRNLPLDVASIEADVDLRGDTADKLYVADVNEITGIALGNSQIETPGFPGAGLIGQLQAMAEKKFRITLFKGDNNMTLEELKNAIQEAKLTPTDIFDMEAILANSLVSEQIKEKIKNAKGYDYRKTESLVEEKAALQKQVDDATAKIKLHEETVKTLKLETAKTKISSLFDTQKTERKLDERQSKFIQNRLGGFTPQKVEDLEKELNGYLDAELKEYATYAKDVFGIEVKTTPDPNKVGNGGTGPEGGKPGGGDAGSKYLDPAQNPFIKTDAV